MQIQQQVCNEYMSEKKISLSRNQYITTRNIFFYEKHRYFHWILSTMYRERILIYNATKHMCTVSSYSCCIHLFTSDFDFSMYSGCSRQFRSLRIVLTNEHGFETRLFNRLGDRQTVQICVSVCEFVCA